MNNKEQLQKSFDELNKVLKDLRAVFLDIANSVQSLTTETNKLKKKGSCHLLFKERVYGYNGLAEDCDKTREQCRLYGNERRYGGN